MYRASHIVYEMYAYININIESQGHKGMRLQ